MRPLAAQAVRYARGQLSLAVRAVAQLPLRVPDEQLYWCEARGDELLIAGERGITEWQGLGAPLDVDGDDLRFELAQGLGFRRLRLRRRPMPPNLFVQLGLDDFSTLDREADLRAPSRWWFRPRGVELEISQRCNLRCTGCAIIDEVEAGYDGPPVEQLLAVLAECERLGVYGYTITGGEPLMKPDVMAALIAGSSMDLLKIQTNAKVFSSAARAEALLGRLADAGLGTRARHVRPSINVSLGMQTDAGTPLANVAHLTAACVRMFGDRVNLVLNVLAWSDAEERQVMSSLDEAYRAAYGRRYPVDAVMRLARFSYNTTPRLESAGLVPIARATVRERIAELPPDFLCMAFERDGSTPLPRILVRADGALYPCSCFGFVGSPGNVYQQPLEALLDAVNADELFREVSRSGLPGLYARAVAARPELADRELPARTTICKVCKALRQPDAPLFAPS